MIINPKDVAFIFEDNDGLGTCTVGVNETYLDAKGKPQVKVLTQKVTRFEATDLSAYLNKREARLRDFLREKGKLESANEQDIIDYGKV